MTALRARVRETSMPDLSDAQRVLETVFGYPSFRLHQGQFI